MKVTISMYFICLIMLAGILIGSYVLAQDTGNMVEIRFNTETGFISAWCKDSKQFGNLEVKEGEEIAYLDMGQLDGKSLEQIRWDGKNIVLRGDYVTPDPIMDVNARILDIEDRLLIIENTLEK